jgi:hypothetical protein
MRYLAYYYPGYESLNDEEFIIQTCGSYETALEEGIISNIPDSKKKDDVTYEDSEDDAPEEKNNTHQTTTIKCVDKSEAKIAFNQLSDIDISITAPTVAVFEKHALELYREISKNCMHRGSVFIEKIITISKNIKFHIYGPGLPRPMDVFRIPYHPIKMVKKFHIHPVKMFYAGGNKLIAFRSCIASLLSGVGQNYNWFSCNKIPLDVMLKYQSRGFSVIINDIEKEAIKIYLNSERERWNPLISKLPNGVDDLFGVTDANHLIFSPDLYQCGLRLGLKDFKRGVVTHTNQVKIPYNNNFSTHHSDKIIMPNRDTVYGVINTLKEARNIEKNTLLSL